MGVFSRTYRRRRRQRMLIGALVTLVMAAIIAAQHFSALPWVK